MADSVFFWVLGRRACCWLILHCGGWRVLLNRMTKDAAAILSSVEVHLDYASRVNFAFQQNRIAILRRLEIRNVSDRDLHGVVCRIQTGPEWANTLEQRISLIPAGSDYTLTDPPLQLDLLYLAELSDRVRGEISLEVSIQGESEAERTLLHQETFPVEVFAFDEWTGLVSLPEILAAFVTPNLSVVDQLLTRTAVLLGKRTGESALSGYQTKSKKRVYEMLACLFEAIREQQIHYSNPPASFEASGQRIRFPDRILRSKLATCLDLSLLFASALEQVGLRPLVLLHQGHAYAGCWLIEESFSDAANDDLQSIRKRVELGEIVLFETTQVCAGRAAGFETAVGAARPHVTCDDVFLYAIDLFRARASGIRPLPLKREEQGIDLASATQPSEPAPIPTPASWSTPEYLEEIEVSGEPLRPANRIDYWKQQLLDLTLRNRLLNFRETKQTIPLVCPEPEELEDELAADSAFSILAQTPMMAGLDPRALTRQAENNFQDPVAVDLRNELAAKRLRSSLTEEELAKRLLDLYRRARLDMEESGSNTLYLALGMLEWKEDKESERIFRAPILLIPVRLTRESSRHSFKLQRYDEDAIINVTLLELLRRDFELEIPGVNPPPEDESGVDVPLLFRLFRQAIRDMVGWEVHRDTWLAQFSFTKFLLWKDLNDRVEMLTHNYVVEHLVNRPGQAFAAEGPGVKEEELDEQVPYDNTFCPVSADSSQLAAIVAASSGKNMVLQGPPGTGKSQTITNLIAHSLALGKRVLFVAEKRAALEVVHRRLSQIGLGPFCLELHSNKAGKADVIRQFGEALHFTEQQTPAEWKILAKKLETGRGELNTYVDELHKEYPNGLSAYRCYSWLISHENPDLPTASATDPLRIDGIETHSREHLEKLRQLCDDLQIRGQERRLSTEAKVALKPFGTTEWTPDWEDEAVAAALRVDAAIAGLTPCLRESSETLGLPVSEAGRQWLGDFVQLGVLLVDAPKLPAAFVQAGDWQAFREQVATAVAAGRERDARREDLQGFDLTQLRNLDLAPIQQKFSALAEKKGWMAGIKRWWSLKPVRELRQKGAAKWRTADAPGFFVTADKWQAACGVVDETSPTAEEALGTWGSEGEAEWARIDAILRFGDDLHYLIHRLAGRKVEQLLQVRAQLGQLLTVAPDVLARDKPIGESFLQLGESWEEMEQAEAHFRELLALREAETRENEGYLKRFAELATCVKNHRKDLQNWCRWQQSYQQAEEAQLGALSRAVERGDFPLEKLRAAFDYNYRENFIRRLITISATLREFWGEEQQKRVEIFNELDERFTRLTAQAVTARLASELPRARKEECPHNTELGILQRELVKRARHKPVRSLFKEIPTILPKLKPCFLMSPLSVAQYLDAGQNDFDLVVFDEASQIPVWDAVGAIARGKQVVIVGDPKQLPPTNFFTRSDPDDDTIDEGMVVDLESILDECIGTQMGVYNLRWHYRSRREGLITFSNRHYYGNRLHTFPSPHAGNAGVRLVAVEDGFYDKGKTRTNLAEAEAIRDEVLQRLTDPERGHQSIGIVTFSQAQQTLILDKLDETRREHPELEAHFGENVEEPVFVKNLENVQGDERDVILFSICYGPDQRGRVSMNFGPLNRAGGERRLNVAVTRAKHEIVVFSTLRGDQIDLSRTRALGVEHLKNYLEYAERGPRALGTVEEVIEPEERAAVFENEVAEFLRKEGFEVDTAIGCSGYKIDLAVVAADEPEQYLIGIECDGPTYRDAATARDRDRLRRSVLEGLGWRMHRIWSTDWWRDREIAAGRLLEVVQEAAKDYAAKKKEKTEVSSNPGYPTDADGTLSVEEEKPAPETEPLRFAGTVTVAEEQGRERMYPEIVLANQSAAETFYEPKAVTQIKKQMRRIVELEGPMTESFLVRRVMEEWGFGRSGSRIRTVLQRCLPEGLAKTCQNDETVYWPKKETPEQFTQYRVPTEQKESRRKAEELPVEEIENAILEILERYLSYPREDLLREAGRRFGIGRLTESISGYMEAALDRVIEKGRVIADDQTIRLKE